jgi:hypothetical protein
MTPTPRRRMSEGRFRRGCAPRVPRRGDFYHGGAEAGGWEPNPLYKLRKLRENPAHGPLTHREKALGPPRTLDLPAVND